MDVVVCSIAKDTFKMNPKKFEVVSPNPEYYLVDKYKASV